ncbi:MAG: GntR family transcriptional regulator [Verrucomicrobia bacterium]|nr:GntR family transcriptional regulator [Verrucomicrobiota bacterium]
MTKLKVETAEPAYVQIAKHVRREIQLGRLAPGQRLPSNPELALQWRVSAKVVQQALAMLAADGALERAPRRGTFVSPKTAQATIGLLFGQNLSEEQAHFYRAAHRVLEREIQVRGWACRTYDYLTSSVGLPRPAQTPVYRDFANDAQFYAFKGLVQFALGPKGLVHPSRMRALPAVVYNPPQRDNDAEMDWTDFGRDGVRYLAEQGCRKILCLVGTDRRGKPGWIRLDGIQEAARELGLQEPRVAWVAVPERGEPFERAAYAQARRVLRPWRGKAAGNGRPDALLVTDDIMMRGVALALVESGFKIPADLRILVQTTEGVNLWYGMPVARYELPLRLIAKEMIALLQRRILGKPLPKLPIKYAGQIKETT